jgi:hypothetical protein
MATSREVEALKQFADDWVHRNSNRAMIRITTYGVPAYRIRINLMDMIRFEETRDQILPDNKSFIPEAETKYTGWLTRNAHTKAAPASL